MANSDRTCNYKAIIYAWWNLLLDVITFSQGSLNGSCVGVPAGAFWIWNGSYPATEVARRARRNSAPSVCVRSRRSKQGVPLWEWRRGSECLRQDKPLHSAHQHTRPPSDTVIVSQERPSSMSGLQDWPADEEAEVVVASSLFCRFSYFVPCGLLPLRCGVIHAMYTNVMQCGVFGDPGTDITRETCLGEHDTCSPGETKLLELGLCLWRHVTSSHCQVFFGADGDLLCLWLYPNRGRRWLLGAQDQNPRVGVGVGVEEGVPASTPSGVLVLSLAKVRLFIKEQRQTGYGRYSWKWMAVLCLTGKKWSDYRFAYTCGRQLINYAWSQERWCQKTGWT